MPKLIVVGNGPGDESLLTGMASSSIKASQKVYNTRELPLGDLLAALKEPPFEDTTVLASGDTGFYSVAKTFVMDLGGLYDIQLIPGISSVQYFCAKIKATYENAVFASLHGRDANIVAKAAYNKEVFALVGGANTVQSVCASLDSHGLGHAIITVGERLSFPEEKITSGSAKELKNLVFDNLSVMYIQNPGAIEDRLPLKDSDFTRSKTPMTKEEIRWLSVAKLGISPNDTLYDIGAGTGSVAVEMARAAYSGYVYAIEANEGACKLVKENAAKHGAFNMQVVYGQAPGALAGLSAPDKVFIGGSSGNMEGIISSILSANKTARIVANAITLQTLAQVVEIFGRFRLQDIDIVCVNTAKSKRVGSYDLMMAQNPVYIITGNGCGTNG
ncbi:MAG: precorrin-6Y C5,15-methyltransferase (decarboxylating) subunit CbiT [Eubacteriaceae bacterium]|nr:precorrin-6Y C5,15-methyltransferase (decarboxylating) subunit CbiT [Eubacteriaceae bacterium]